MVGNRISHHIVWDVIAPQGRQQFGSSSSLPSHLFSLVFLDVLTERMVTKDMETFDKIIKVKRGYPGKQKQ